MRRVRCPYCDSLKTAPVLIGFHDSAGMMDVRDGGWVCDECDQGWETDAERRQIKANRKARA